jgi:hypothetical protein
VLALLVVLAALIVIAFVLAALLAGLLPALLLLAALITLVVLALLAALTRGLLIVVTHGCFLRIELAAIASTPVQGINRASGKPFPSAAQKKPAARLGRREFRTLFREVRVDLIKRSQSVGAHGVDGDDDDGGDADGNQAVFDGGRAAADLAIYLR